MRFRTKVAHPLAGLLALTLLAAACGTAETESPSATQQDSSAGEVLTGGDTASAADTAAGADSAVGADTAYNICTSGIANCDKNATCIGISDTKYECKCNEGFEGSGKVCCGPGYKATPGGCSDIHECNDKVDDCDPNASCANTTGGFTCKCKTGYQGDGKTCTANGSDVSAGDVDAGSLPDTGPTPDTTGGTDAGSQPDTGPKPDTTGGTDAGSQPDTGGSCPAGYYNSGSGCTDLNECTSGAAKCSDKATCTNTPGSFTCTCNAGFEGDGKTCCGPGFKQSSGTCQDIHECNEGLDDCADTADCANNTGGYTCKCKTGYSGDGKTCADVDECATGAAKCTANSTCKNSQGSFACTCNAGYKQAGTSCFDVDECLDKTDGCPAACINTPGSFTCTSTVFDTKSEFYNKSCDPTFSFHKYSWKGTAPNETYEYQTKLVADCRCGGNKQAPGVGGLYICQRPSEVPLQISFGTGPTVRKLPNASMLGGYFDAKTRKVYAGIEWQDSFYEDQGVILAIDADTGNRTIVTGQWVSDANGYETYGQADPAEKTYFEEEIVGVGKYKNPLGRTYTIEMGADGYLYAMTVDKDLYTVIVRVDIATGNRKIMWAEHRTLDPQGKNNPAHVQCSNGAKSGGLTVQLNQYAGFALEPSTGDYLLPVIQGATTSDITPNGVVRIKKDGSGCSWVTRFGMGSNNGFAGQTIGTGPLAQFSFDALEMHNGKLLAVEMDTNQDIFEIDLATGKRTVLGEGVSTDWLDWDAKRGLMWGGGTGMGTAVNSWNMTSGIVFQHLGLLLAKAVDFQRVAGPLSTCCGTHLPGWVDPLNGQLILMHNAYSLVRMEPESGNSVILSL
jgi:hypothetical protein